MILKKLITGTQFTSIFRFYMENKGWWDAEKEENWKRESRRQVMQSFARSENLSKPPVEELFHDVYDEMPENLRNQFKECMEQVKKYPNEYPTDIYKKKD